MGSTRLKLAMLVTIGCLTITGCTSAQSTPKNTISSSTPSAAPTFVAGGTAADNLTYFDSVNEKIASGSDPDPTAFLAALSKAGFYKGDMQATADSQGQPAFQFAVKVGNSCLIGQYGPAKKYSGTVASPISTGACLIGEIKQAW